MDEREVPKTGWRDDDKILELLRKQSIKIDTLVAAVKLMQLQLAQLIQAEIPQPAVKFAVAITGGSMSTVRKASVDFQLLDNGTAKLTATPLDKKGLATKLPAAGIVANWKSSDPGVVITVDLANDPSGLTAIAAPSDPPVLVTGAVPTVTADNVPQDDGTTATITGDGAPIDVVAGAAGSFVVAEG